MSNDANTMTLTQPLDQALLLVAAPQMVLALCLAEASSFHEGGACGHLCAGCGSEDNDSDRGAEVRTGIYQWHVIAVRHKPACPLHAALSEAGIPQAERAQIRREWVNRTSAR